MTSGAHFMLHQCLYNKICIYFILWREIVNNKCDMYESNMYVLNKNDISSINLNKQLDFLIYSKFC